MSKQKTSFRKLKELNVNGETLHDVDISKYLSFKCGGNVKFLLKVKTLEGFLKTLMYLQENDVHYFVLGAGSNILCSDKGYNGVLIKLEGDFARIQKLDDCHIECGAGIKLGILYSHLLKWELSGIESGAGIPASIGGAVYMNAGAFGFEMADVVDYVVAFCDGKIKYFSKADCFFGYRDSVFQHNKGVILRVGLRLTPQNKEKTQEKFKEVSQKRISTQPLNFPSAGSVFRRIEGVNVSKMLDEHGFKGMTIGGAQVSSKHANFIVNVGGAKSQDIYSLILKMKKEFKAKSGLDINTEIQFLGEFDEVTW